MKSIPLTQGKVALVDDEDFDRVNAFKWSCMKYDHLLYAGRKFMVDGKKKCVKMHQFILGMKPGKIDHRDRDGLNNQRFNLRPCSSIENGRNRKLQKHSSKFKGVSRTPKAPVGSEWEWKACARLNKKLVHLGYFGDEKAAAMAYDSFVIKHFGEFASTNQQLGAL